VNGAPLRIVILGLSITSSWGNGHASTYRSLVRALAARGHDVLFLERDVAWYASNRDLPHPPFGRTVLYSDLGDLDRRCSRDVERADCVIVGSYLPDGITVGDWVFATSRKITAFYDFDTPVTLGALERDRCEYLAARQIPRYDIYLSLTGGPALRRLEREYYAPRARPLYCSFDPGEFYPVPADARWDLGYMGTYGLDRQPRLDALLLQAAASEPQRSFVVAGSSYPAAADWPSNVERIEHLPQSAHRMFYTAQRFTLNLTRAPMLRLGHSPSVRLFEAAACATAIVSDTWDGLETFFVPGREILVADTTDDVLRLLRDLPDDERQLIGARARARVLRAHTPQHRAVELEQYVAEAVRGRHAQPVG
jgi:spore maturation protein CgeB